MKIVLIKRNEPRHKYFANQMCTNFAVEKILWLCFAVRF